jgi:hypothetical protein
MFNNKVVFAIKNKTNFNNMNPYENSVQELRQNSCKYAC